MADYKILVPPSRPHRRAWIAVGVAVVVVAVVVVAFVVGRSAHGPGTAATAGKGSTTSVPVTPLTVASSVPTSGATQVPSDQVVTVTMSGPVSSGVNSPVFSPPVSGTWRQSGAKSLVFDATAPFLPTSTETLTIPAGSAGPRSVHGGELAAPVTITFGVAQASTERLQQLLAQLGYLPLTFTATGATPPNGAATSQAGVFAWRWTTLPPI